MEHCQQSTTERCVCVCVFCSEQWEFIFGAWNLKGRMSHLTNNITFHKDSLDLLISTANSDSESEASYAPVPKRESTGSKNSAARNRYR